MKLCITGAMTGSIHGGLPTQAEALVDLFRRSDYSVITASSYPNRYHRLADILWTLLKNRKEIDLQILQVFSGLSFVQEDLTSLFAKVLKIPTVMFLRGGSLPEFGRKYPRWTRRVLSRANIIVAPSNYLVRDLSWLGLPIQIIPNTISISRYPYRERTHISPYLFWMRSFFWYYRPSVALQVANNLLPNFPNLTLTMAGPDKGLLNETRRLAGELNISEKITFPGLLGLDDKVKMADKHDIYLNTNTVDNMPVSVLEMAALGLPIVATAVGGVPDLLEHEKTALLVPDGDYKAMADAVRRLLSNSDLTRRLSRNGRELAEHCSGEYVILEWEKIFTRIARR